MEHLQTTHRRILSLLGLTISILFLLIIFPDANSSFYPHLSLLSIVALLCGIIATGSSKKHVALGVIFAIPPLIFHLLLTFSGNLFYEQSAVILSLPFFIFTTYSIFQFLLIKPIQVTEWLLAALCTALLLGMTWGILFTFLEVLSPGSILVDGQYGDFTWVDLIPLSFTFLLMLSTHGILEPGTPAYFLGLVEILTGFAFGVFVIWTLLREFVERRKGKGVGRRA